MLPIQTSVVSDLSSVKDVVTNLRPLLPSANVVFRRLQTAIREIEQLNASGLESVDSCLLCSFDATEPTATWPKEFTIIFMTPLHPEGVPIWLYTSLETPNVEKSSAHEGAITDQLVALLSYFKDLPLFQGLKDTPLWESGLLVGMADVINIPAIRQAGVLIEEGEEFVRLFFNKDEVAARDFNRSTPEQLCWDDIRVSDHAAIQKSMIPVRSSSAISSWASLGVRDRQTRELVAYIFWGAEGSVRGIFVFPEWRGKKLSKTLLGRLLLGSAGGYDPPLPADHRWPGQDLWFQAHVLKSNVESNALMRSMGARVGPVVCLPRLDLRRLSEDAK